MDKDYATLRLGGSEEQASRWLGVSAAVYRGWPETLPPVMTDRVIAASLRREAATALGIRTPKAFFADWRNEAMIEAMFSRVAVALVWANLMPRVPAELARPGAADLTQEIERVRRKRAKGNAAAAAPAAG